MPYDEDGVAQEAFCFVPISCLDAEKPLARLQMDVELIISFTSSLEFDLILFFKHSYSMKLILRMHPDLQFANFTVFFFEDYFNSTLILLMVRLCPILHDQVPTPIV